MIQQTGGLFVLAELTENFLLVYFLKFVNVTALAC